MKMNIQPKNFFLTVLAEIQDYKYYSTYIWILNKEIDVLSMFEYDLLMFINNILEY